MLAGDLIARLRLEGASKFQADLNAAKSGFDRLASAGQSVNTALAGVGNVVNTAGAAVAVLGTKAVAAGADFNRLQQNSGVALKTLLGSSEAAQRQLEKLNAFTSKSPFGRDTFMRAQQTLLGFGLEAGKVVPYLDAIQNAVAGIGGSNADIEGVTQVIAKIRSSATLGQQDLLELGNRGINAAALIAKATGKTEKQVRESIFGDPMRGEEALAGLDAMMKGMSQRFAGTTDELKKQFDGAKDRVKAAMRDIGAVLTAPVIDPQGGGWGVTLTNSYADVLRAVQSSITPMVASLQTQLGPTVLQVNTHLQRLASTVRSVDMSMLREGFARIEPILPAVAGGLAAISAKGLASIPILSSLGMSFNPLVTGLVTAAAATPELRDAFGDIMQALSPLVPVVGEVASILAGQFSVALSAVGTVVSALAPGVEMIADVIAAIPAPVLAAGTAFVVLGGALKNITGAIGNTGLFQGFNGVIQQMTAEAQRAHAAGLTPMSSAIAGLQTGVSAATGGLKGIGSAIMGAFGGPVGLAITGITTAVTLYSTMAAQAAQDTAEWKAGVEALSGTLDQSTGAITANTRSHIAAELQAGEWGSRVKELVGGQADLADMTMAVTGESDKLTNQLQMLVQSQVGLDTQLNTTSSSTIKFSDLLKKLGMSATEFVRLAASGDEGIEQLRASFEAAGYSGREFNTVLESFGSKAKGINFDALKEIYGMAEQLGFASDATRELAEAEKEMEAAGSAAAATQAEFQEAIRTTGDSAASTEERLRAMWKIIDLLNGGTLTAAEQQQQLDDAIRGTADAFEAANEASGGLKANLIDSSGAIDTSTEAGSRFRDELLSIKDSMGEAGIAAANLAKAQGGDQYAAALAAMQPYVDEVRAMAKEYGLSDAQVQGLLESLGMLPEDAAIALSMDGLEGVNGELGVIALMLRDLEEGSSINVATLTDEAKAELEALGFTVTQLNDGTWQVNMGADATEARARLAELMAEVNGSTTLVAIEANTHLAEQDVINWQNAANETVAIPQVDADAAAAEGKVLAWKLQADGTYAVSHMDAEKAAADSKVITWKRNADGTYAVAHVGAEARDAYGRLNGFVGVANTSWASVNVNADTGPARRAIAGLNGATVWVNAQVNGHIKGFGAIQKRDGGLDTHSLSGLVEEFANGGFPTGVYRSGTPIYKFAEPETGWEAFISGRRGQERRNLQILEEAARRLRQQLGVHDVQRMNVTPFANGGIVTTTAPMEQSATSVTYSPTIVLNEANMSPHEFARRLRSEFDQYIREAL